MPTTINKQRLLTFLFNAFKGRPAVAEPEARSVLAEFIYAICREGTTRERADRAFRTLHERFYDWNEIRVSSVREVQDALAGLPNAEHRAHRLIVFLQEVFETTFSFDLDSLQKKGLKQAAKQLSRYQAANDYAVAWVVQSSLGGHAIPVDEPSRRVLHRLGLIENGQDDPEALRAGLEHLVPKARGPQFCQLISNIAEEYCLDAAPICPRCPLASECQTGQTVGHRPSGNRAHRPKPR